MVNFVFLPQKKTIKGWIMWLHGGPQEQISPRYNVFFNYLNKEGYGIICINYRGSTGIGNQYELRKKNAIQNIQLKSVKTALDQIKKELDIKGEKVSIIAVSYGAILAHKYIFHYPDEVDKMVDFSGITNFLLPTSLSDLNHKPEFLFISGNNDFALNNNKVNIIESYRNYTDVEVLIIENEGHYIRRKKNVIASINKILGFLEH